MNNDYFKYYVFVICSETAHSYNVLVCIFLLKSVGLLTKIIMLLMNILSQLRLFIYVLILREDWNTNMAEIHT